MESPSVSIESFRKNFMEHVDKGNQWAKVYSIEFDNARKIIRQRIDVSKGEVERQVKQAKEEINTLLICIIVWMLSAYLMSLMGVVASLRAPVGGPLPDLGFDLFAWIPVPNILTNAILSIIVVLTVIRVILHPQRVVIFRRLLVVHSVVMLTRSFFVVATSLPDPYPGCQGYELKNNIFIEAFIRMVTFGFFVCGDVFFSGHMAIVTLCGMVWIQYTNNEKLKFFMIFLIFLESCVLTGTKFHYTIDVVIGAYLSIRTWRSYHRYRRILSWFETEIERLHHHLEQLLEFDFPFNNHHHSNSDNKNDNNNDSNRIIKKEK